MGESRAAAPEAWELFRHFLAERWSGGRTFELWILGHPEHEEDLRRLHDEWLAELGDDPGILDSAPLTPPHDRRWAVGAHVAGEVFGGYRLLERLGAGAMGEVWKAEELALRRLVALKLLRPDLVADPRALERFRREGLAGAISQHPGVVTVLAVGRFRGQPFIAQELVPGPTLSRLIAEARERGAPDAEFLRRAARLIAQATDALEVAHAAGIVHRDIKPGNLLVAPGDQLKVADFGLARLKSEEPISHSGDVMGTYSYMSPEQLHGQPDELEAASDIFSLGVTLYELCTFQRAFQGDSVHSIMQRILNLDPVDPRRIVPRFPRELAHILAKALEKRPGDRYASMREFGDDLRRFLEGRPIRARPTPLWRRALKWSRRNRTQSVAGAVVLAVVAGAAATWRVLEAERVESQRDRLHAEALYAIEIADLDRAAGLIAEANELDPSDPTGHLILAIAYGRYTRSDEAAAELEQAFRKGFTSDPSELRTGLEHGAYGLYLQSRHDYSLYPEAQRHIERAMELDPTLHALNFPLYQMRSALEDGEGARRALDDYRKSLKTGDPFYEVVTALGQEISGDFAGAAATLEALRARPDVDDQRLVQLGWHRTLGRVLMGTGELARAEELLRRSVAERPKDCWSWGYLAVVYERRLQRGERTQAILDEMARCARMANECSPSLRNPLMLLAFAAIETCRLQGGPDSSGRPWQEARAALARFREWSGGKDPDLWLLEGRLAFLEGLLPFGRKDYRLASEHFERALALDPQSVEAAVCLSNSLWWLGGHGRGLEVLQSALSTWDDPGWERDREDALIGALLAWMLGHASKAGDQKAFSEARARLVKELEAKRVFPPEALLNAAEFLAKAPAEWRDCELAYELLYDHSVMEALAGGPDAAEAEKILDEIGQACP